MLKIIEKRLCTLISLKGTRLDRALAELLPEYSRSKIKTWIEQGNVLVNDTAQKPKDKLFGREIIKIRAQLHEETHDNAQAIPLNIVYEDSDILIINKPIGLVVHPGAGNPEGTLLNALLYHCPNNAHLPRAGIIHRLDKDTSGLLVIAKTLSAHTFLVKALQEREIKREYEALVYGDIISGGTIDAPIERHARLRTHMAVKENGRDAITHYRVLERFHDFTHLKLNLETGRTHQIRVHLAHILHPIVGDTTYGRIKLPKGAPEPLIKALQNFKHQALHARRLGLTHPATQKWIEFEAPLPQDMQTLLEVIQKNNQDEQLRAR